MEVMCVVVGPLDENCYILKKNNTCLVIDPGDDYLKIKESIGEDKVIGVLITHSHFDHVGALRHFISKRGIKIFKKSISPEGEYEIKDFKFKDSIGRVDLPGGSEEEMRDSLKKIQAYPKDTVLYPGHGEATILSYELQNNSYIKEFLSCI